MRRRGLGTQAASAVAAAAAAAANSAVDSNCVRNTVLGLS